MQSLAEQSQFDAVNFYHCPLNDYISPHSATSNGDVGGCGCGFLRWIFFRSSCKSLQQKVAAGSYSRRDGPPLRGTIFFGASPCVSTCYPSHRPI